MLPLFGYTDNVDRFLGSISVTSRWNQIIFARFRLWARRRFLGDDFVNPPDEFRKHAAECMRMAASTRNAKEKAAWTGLAQRWTACAAVSEADYGVARQSKGAAAAQRGSSASARL
jgi:hypothetical protein